MGETSLSRHHPCLVFILTWEKKFFFFFGYCYSLYDKKDIAIIVILSVILSRFVMRFFSFFGGCEWAVRSTRGSDLDNLDRCVEDLHPLSKKRCSSHPILVALDLHSCLPLSPVSRLHPSYFSIRYDIVVSFVDYPTLVLPWLSPRSTISSSFSKG